jgi:hypothetical protein
MPLWAFQLQHPSSFKGKPKHKYILSHLPIFTLGALTVSGIQRDQPPQGRLLEKFENMQICKCADESPHIHFFTLWGFDLFWLRQAQPPQRPQPPQGRLLEKFGNVQI